MDEGIDHTLVSVVGHTGSQARFSHAHFTLAVAVPEGMLTRTWGRSELLVTGYLLNTMSDDFSNIRITQSCVEHYVMDLALWPVQLKVPLDERGTISVNRVNVY